MVCDVADVAVETLSPIGWAVRGDPLFSTVSALIRRLCGYASSVCESACSIVVGLLMEVKYVHEGAWQCVEMTGRRV